MATRVRTRSHSERTALLNIVSTFILRADVDEDIKRAEERLFRAEATRWEAAYAAHRDALRMESVATDDVAVVESAFDVAARLWAATLCGADGRSLSSRLTGLLGGRSLGTVLAGRPADKATRIADLLARLPVDLERAGNADHLASLRAATVALKQATDGGASLAFIRLSRGRELEAASEAFDAAAGRLGRSLTALLGRDGCRDLLPAFSDAPKRKEKTKTPTAAATKTEPGKEPPKDQNEAGKTEGAEKTLKSLKTETPPAKGKTPAAKKEAPPAKTETPAPPEVTNEEEEEEEDEEEQETQELAPATPPAPEKPAAGANVPATPPAAKGKKANAAA